MLLVTSNFPRQAQYWASIKREAWQCSGNKNMDLHGDFFLQRRLHSLLVSWNCRLLFTVHSNKTVSTCICVYN
jgi:hypothetical protein